MPNTLARTQDDGRGMARTRVRARTALVSVVTAVVILAASWGIAAFLSRDPQADELYARTDPLVRRDFSEYPYERDGRMDTAYAQGIGYSITPFKGSRVRIDVLYVLSEGLDRARFSVLRRVDQTWWVDDDFFGRSVVASNSTDPARPSARSFVDAFLVAHPKHVGWSVRQSRLERLSESQYALHTVVRKSSGHWPRFYVGTYVYDVRAKKWREAQFDETDLDELRSR